MKSKIAFTLAVASAMAITFPTAAQTFSGTNAPNTGTNFSFTVGAGAQARQFLELINKLAASADAPTLGFIVAATADNHFLVIAGLTVTVAGLLGTYGPYYSLASSFFAGPAAPGAIALINLMCTGLGGFLGPNIIGLLRQGTGGYTAGMFALAGGLVVSVVILLLLGRVMAARTAATAGA